MTTARTKAPPASSATDAAETPWYELINEVPEPPEDGLVEDAVITLIKAILIARYANDPATLVLGPATFLIYDSDTPGSLIAPDCYVMFGVDADFILRYRQSYRIEEWGVIPAFALEVASPSTARGDLTEKRELYARIGVGEYWRLDVTGGENYGEPLVGERLVNGEYVRFELHSEPNGDTWSRSEVLGVDFYYRAEEGYGAFLLRDGETGEWMNDLSGEIAAHAQTEVARQAAEARNRELEAELERLRRQLDQQ